MSSGSYFPPPVRLVEIPKDDGRHSAAGHSDGGRPCGANRGEDGPWSRWWTRSSIRTRMAIDPASRRSTRSKRAATMLVVDWVIDLDIKGFFDTIRMSWSSARSRGTPTLRGCGCTWPVASSTRCSGRTAHGWQRTKGTPQGGVVSPLLANLFLHYAFDVWMQRTYPGVPFERYADDVIVHCRSNSSRPGGVGRDSRVGSQQCGLALHPTKTRIVYCKDADRPGRVRTRVVRLSRLHLPTSARAKSLGKNFCWLSAGDQHQGRQSIRQHHPRMVDGVHERSPSRWGTCLGSRTRRCGGG